MDIFHILSLYGRESRNHILPRFYGVDIDSELFKNILAVEHHHIGEGLGMAYLRRGRCKGVSALSGKRARLVKARIPDSSATASRMA